MDLLFLGPLAGELFSSPGNHQLNQDNPVHDLGKFWNLGRSRNSFYFYVRQPQGEDTSTPTFKSIVDSFHSSKCFSPLSLDVRRLSLSFYVQHERFKSIKSPPHLPLAPLPAPVGEKPPGTQTSTPHLRPMVTLTRFR